MNNVVEYVNLNIGELKYQINTTFSLTLLKYNSSKIAYDLGWNLIIASRRYSRSR
jgi:hypothetical protein